jgi:hypothetical protein
MMRLAVTASLLSVALGLGNPASAGAPGPVCRVPTVVDEMSRRIHEGNYYARVDPRLVTETPTPTPNLVRCQVCVLETPYDTPRFGSRPVRRCTPRQFEVHILPQGFVVR